jgi:hypothetical protein
VDWSVCSARCRGEEQYLDCGHKRSESLISITRCKLAVAPYEGPWTEALTPTGSCANSELMNAAKREEILNLIRRGTFKIATLPENHNENSVPSRFVLAIKHSDTGETKCKARFAVGGHKDKLKHSMVYTASTLRRM